MPAWSAGALTPGDVLRLPQALSIREQPADEPGGQMGQQRPKRCWCAPSRRSTRCASARAGTCGPISSAARRRSADLIERDRRDAGPRPGAGRGRLLERAREVSASLPIDQATLAQEVVRVAQRSDITEEVIRFRAHLEHWDALTDADEPCGRKLDFLLQEMNREINTIGSKADGVPVSELIIQAKSELERMREQVQNVE